MNKKYKSLTVSFITLFFLFNFLLHSEVMIKTFFDTTTLWFYNLFPSIFIFFIITDILNNYHFSYYLSKIFGIIISKIYKLPNETSYILFMSMTSGFPGNSKLIKEQLDEQIISLNDANKLLTMTHFSNPLFIIYTIGITFFHDKKLGLIILLIHFITNYLIGFLFRNIYHEKPSSNKLTLDKPKPFIQTLTISITNTLPILFNVFGIVLFFSLFTKTINLYLNLNAFSNTLVNGLLEITNGLNLLSTLAISKIKKATLATFFISFGGFSIHAQIFSILNKYHLNYYLYLIARILHASISSLLVFIINFLIYR